MAAAVACDVSFPVCLSSGTYLAMQCTLPELAAKYFRQCAGRRVRARLVRSPCHGRSRTEPTKSPVSVAAGRSRPPRAPEVPPGGLTGGENGGRTLALGIRRGDLRAEAANSARRLSRRAAPPATGAGG